MNEKWRDKLIAGARRDVEVRTRLAASGALFAGYNPEMEALHNENAALLAEVFDAIGWPGRDKLGDDGAAAAFLILQHAISRPDVQRRGLALMMDALEKNEANSLDAAYLSDRIAVMEGRPQVFGTQFDWDEQGLLSPAALVDPPNIDARRAAVGLPPMAETIARVRANAAGNRLPRLDAPDLATAVETGEAAILRCGIDAVADHGRRQDELARSADTRLPEGLQLRSLLDGRQFGRLDLGCRLAEGIDRIDGIADGRTAGRRR